MASSLSPSSPAAIFRPNFKFRSVPLHASQIRAQSYRVEAAGRSSKIVDANLSRKRIDQEVGLPLFQKHRQYFKFRITPHQASQIRAQSNRDEGRSSKLVDENLNVLRERMEKVKVKEKLERCYRRQYDWNYAAGYNDKLKREAQMLKLFELVRVILGTLGFTFLSGTTLLFLVSILVHMSQ
ncbi:hypothetical protein SLE2022_274970 [Rubroshorea leprosula]